MPLKQNLFIRLCFFRLIDWLDEYIPGSFRQAQVSFSSKIPQAFPIGDAMTMSPHLQLYNNYGHARDLQDAFKSSHSKSSVSQDPKVQVSGPPAYTANAMGKSSPGQSDNTLIPNVLMLSKHGNGSLNQWQVRQRLAQAPPSSVVRALLYIINRVKNAYCVNLETVSYV